MYEFDVIFIDTVCPKPYNLDTLLNEPMGGTEATVVRVAEGLGELGLKVGVLQHSRTMESMGRHAFYLPLDTQVNPKRVIHLRSIGLLDRFPNTRQYVWMHDNPNDSITPWVGKFKQFNVTVLGVSDWHCNRLSQYLPGVPIKRIYNPIDKRLHGQAIVTPDKINFIWMSSPHKGLDECVRVFGKIRQQLPEAELHVFNPGYLKDEFYNAPGVRMHGPTPPNRLYSYLCNSTAVLYPTLFEETFGIFAAEANALGVPVLFYPIAGLAEIVTNKWANSEAHLIIQAVMWAKKRPTVTGRPSLSLANVIQDWLTILRAKV